MAWSRYAIPTRNIPKSVLDALRAQLSAHILGADARVNFADYLFSPDQLPQGYTDTWAFADALWNAAAANKDLKVDSKLLAESQLFVSDVRYLIAAVQVPPGGRCSAGTRSMAAAPPRWWPGANRAGRISRAC